MNPDHSQVVQIEERLKSAAKRLHALSLQVGSAKQVKTYDTDRRKNLLSRYIVPALKNGESATAAEAIARATPAYHVELEALASQLEDAEKTIAEWDAEYASWESARSLLSWQKETLKTFQE